MSQQFTTKQNGINRAKFVQKALEQEVVSYRNRRADIGSIREVLELYEQLDSLGIQTHPSAALEARYDVIYSNMSDEAKQQVFDEN